VDHAACRSFDRRRHGGERGEFDLGAVLELLLYALGEGHVAGFCVVDKNNK
jgi:hypothetical protein